MVLETGASTQPAGHFGIEAQLWAPPQQSRQSIVSMKKTECSHPKEPGLKTNTQHLALRNNSQNANNEANGHQDKT